jgi:hypothetical protein
MQSLRPFTPLSSTSSKEWAVADRECRPWNFVSDSRPRRSAAMPIRQYFAWMGSVLLVALFVADWWLPAPSARPHSEFPPNERVNLRIRSDHKWPERIVFDTAHSGLPLAAEASPEPDVPSAQDLAGSEQRGPLDAFAAAEPADAARAATNEKASAIHAKPRPARFHMTGMVKAD